MVSRVSLIVLASALTCAPVAAASAQDMSSRFAQPATGAAARGLADEETQAIAGARSAVAEMRALARTDAEHRMVERTAALVEDLALSIAERGRLRSEMRRRP